MKKIYTIGYQGRTIAEFLKLLKKYEIDHLVDVRSYPTSKMQDFSKKNLKDTLFKKSFMYKHLPGLGGLGDEVYKKTMLSDRWKSSYEKLKDLAKDGTTAMMCLEKDPSQCHRRFISDRLKKEGWEVVHIGKGGSWKRRSLEDFK
ncbi:MAG: DUF488 family protein [Thermoplasmatota archaeon]